MMTVQYRILKSHINKDGIKVIDKMKVESVDLYLTPTDEYTVVPETEAHRQIIKRTAEELAKQLRSKE